MTHDDFQYISKLLSSNELSGSILELGGGYGGNTCRQLIVEHGLDYHATDLHASQGVDFVANFETGEGVEKIKATMQFDCVLVLNVLEHVFNPITVIDNVLTLCKSKAKIVIITPTIWALHNYPIDCARLNPDWYRRYAQINQLSINDDFFEYLGYCKVADLRSEDQQDNYPTADHFRPVRRLWSRAIHKLFNTFGRGMYHPSLLAVGVVLER